MHSISDSSLTFTPSLKQVVLALGYLFPRPALALVTSCTAPSGSSSPGFTGDWLVTWSAGVG